MSVSLNLRTATIDQLLQCLPLILNSETASEIIKLRDRNSFFGPADLSRVTGRSESEWISLLEAGVISIPPVPGQSPNRSVISVGSILFQESPQQSEARLPLQIPIPAQEPMVGATNFYAGPHGPGTFDRIISALPRDHVYSRSQLFPETDRLVRPLLSRSEQMSRSNRQFTSATANVRYNNQLYDPPQYVEIDPPPYNEVSHTHYQPHTRPKIASSVNQPAPASIIPRVVEEVNSSPESVRHPWVTLRNRNRNRPMTDPGNGQQSTQMAHSQTLGRREDYGGARPRVVDQVLHDITHDMENTGIQGRESIQSDHVQTVPPHCWVNSLTSKTN